MSEITMCTPYRKDGVAMCKKHEKPLVDRSTLQSFGIEWKHPPIGETFCPETGQVVHFSHEVDKFLGHR